MKIVVMSWLERRSVEAFLHSQVVYRPDLATRAPAAAATELQALQPDVVIARSTQGAQLAAIDVAVRLGSAKPALRWHSIVCALASQPPDAAGMPPHCTVVTASNWAQAEHEAFVLAERLGRPRPASLPAPGPRRGEVVLVGAGVVNLVTALVLHHRGHAVSVHDRMADPLSPAAGTPANAGATFGGKDARIFSFNESRQHLAPAALPALPGHEFRRTIAQEGWLCRTPASLARADRAWVDAVESVPGWAAQQYGNDIVRFNRDSDAAWRRWFSLYPELLAGVHHVGRLWRVYPSAASLAAAREAEARIGALVGVLDAAQVAACEPALADAVASGAVAGALQVRGFSLNVQAFCRNLIRLLRRQGVRFHWEQSLSGVVHDKHGQVAELLLGGRPQAAHHCVISPGAYGHAIRSRLSAPQAIGSMVGLWVTLPNGGPALATPLKVRRRGLGSEASAQGANVIPGLDSAGRPVLHCSSGHGFVGIKPGNVKVAALQDLGQCVLQTAQELFPAQFERARVLGWLDGPPAHCVRPWTPSGLGLFESLPTASGGRLVFTGGHNTGGFAQSPAVADAVACALEGREHPMHLLYHPRRFEAVFGEAA